MNATEFSTTYLTAVFLIGRGHMPTRAAAPPQPRGELRFMFPESARPQLKELRAARAILDAMAEIAEPARPQARSAEGGR